MSLGQSARGPSPLKDATKASSLVKRLRDRRTENVANLLGHATEAAREWEPALPPSYLGHLPRAIAAAYDYLVDELEVEWLGCPATPPTPVRVQAQLAAAFGVPIESLLRRSAMSNAIMGSIVLREAARMNLSDSQMVILAQRQVAISDTSMSTLTKAYRQECQADGSVKAKKVTQVTEALAGEETYDQVLGYRMEGHHVAIVGRGKRMDEFLVRLADTLRARSLVVQPGRLTRWAWIQKATPAPPSNVAGVIKEMAPRDTPVAIGSCENGAAGWRASHLQAVSLFPFCVGGAAALTYEDRALEASIAQDQVLADYLRRRYLQPIRGDRADGEALLGTLKAYFSTARNAVSAAALLGISRQTVANRLRAIEERLGLPLQSCAVALEVAVRLGDLDDQLRS
jgi:PucR C-terminal helix-turn-helix domain/GGDEF-like domain